MFIVGRLGARLLGLPLLTIDVHFAVGPDAWRRTLTSQARGTGRRWPRRARRRLPPGGATRPRPVDRRLARSAELVREATTVLDGLHPR